MSISDRIERAARVIADHVGFLDDLDSDPQNVQDVYLHPVALARALDQAGVLAPGSLREEWGTRFGSSEYVHHGADVDYPFFFKGDPPKGTNVHRYVTAWEPVDGIDRSEGGKAATSG